MTGSFTMARNLNLLRKPFQRPLFPLRQMSGSPDSGNMSGSLLSQINSKHLAAGTSAPKTDPDKITFYNMRFCPYAQRSALVLSLIHI